MLALTVVLLALPSLTCGVTLHVRPTSTNTSCPTHPCQTLSEYAQDPGQYFNDSNLTLQFLPGNHTLDINLNIRNISQLEIHGALLPTKVFCDFHVGFTFSNIHRVCIDGLAFVACARSHVVQFSYPVFSYPEKTYYGLHLQSVPMAEIIDCTFQDSYGSALRVVDSRVVLRDNNFINNCWLCSNGSCYGLFYQGPRCYGGGVFARMSNLSITGSSSFSGNSAWDGGGVYARYSSNVYISGNTTFSGNLAKRYGGGVSAWNSSNVNISGNTTFSGNSAGWNGGGVTAWRRSNVYIIGNTIFSGNSASRDGGGVSAWYSSNVYISGNTTLSGNSARRYGGGLSAQSSSNVYISGDTIFSGNSASYGGGVSAWDRTNVYISGNTTFGGNSGGGVSAWDRTNMYISGNTTFGGNSAGYGDGGALSVFCGNVYITGDTTFIGNSARYGDGGALSVLSGNVYISGNAMFSSNSARIGGGVSLYK